MHKVKANLPYYSATTGLFIFESKKEGPNLLTEYNFVLSLETLAELKEFLTNYTDIKLSSVIVTHRTGLEKKPSSVSVVKVGALHPNLVTAFATAYLYQPFHIIILCHSTLLPNIRCYAIHNSL